MLINRIHRRLMASSATVQQKFKYFLILDFEATCESNKQVEPQEIIEFPCLKLNAQTLTIDSVFHRYVRPVAHPRLSSFCTELTGIVQDMVDGEPTFPSVLNEFENWLRAEDLYDNQDSAVVTCGDWDLKSILPRQCDLSQLPIPPYFSQWINLKKPFFKHSQVWPKGMMHMLEILKVDHVGRHHSGLDDAKNISNIVCKLIENGVVLDITAKASS